MKVADRLVREKSCRSTPMTARLKFDLLFSLAKAAGRIKTREQLLREVADRHFDILDRSIDVHISSIRKKLGDDPRCPRFIATIRNADNMMCKPARKP
jgi:DNA-binding response OmpR family regulator